MNACKKCGRMTTRKELFSSFYDHCDVCDAPKKKADAIGDVVIGDETILTLPPGMKFNHDVAWDTIRGKGAPIYGSPANQVVRWSTRKDTLVLNGTKEIMSVTPGSTGYWSDNLDAGDVLQINTHTWTCPTSGMYELEFNGSVLIITRVFNGVQCYMDPNRGLIAGSVRGKLPHSAPQVQSIPKTPQSSPNLKDLSIALDDAKKKLDELKITKPSNRITSHAQRYQYGEYWRDGDRCFISVTHVGDMKDIIPPGLEMEGGLKLEVLGIHDEPTLFSFKVKGWTENL